MLSRIKEKMPPVRPVEITGFSLSKMLLIGLILPTIVVSSLLLSIRISMNIGLPLMVAGIVTCLWTFASFAAGTFILITFSNRIVEHIKVKKK